jgi:hypothetical protein
MNNTASVTDIFLMETFLWIIPTAFLIVFFTLKYSRPNDLVELK